MAEARRAKRGSDSNKRMPPRVLIICAAFPPTNHVSSLRGVRIGNAFLKRGWEVHVLKSEYSSWPQDLNLDVSRFHVHAYALGRLGRLLATASPKRTIISIGLSVLRALVLPEYTWLMRSGLRTSIDLMGGLEQFDCVVSSSPPFVLHDVCRERKEAGERFCWIADMRDAWLGSSDRRTLAPAWLERRIERDVFKTCNAAVFTSETTGANYAAQYGIKPHLVLNGYGGEVVPGKPSAIAGKRLRFVHTGILYRGRRDLRPLLTAIEGLAARSASELILCGLDSMAVAKALAATSSVPIKGLGQVPRSQSLTLQGDADFLVIATEDSDFHASYTPAKLFEYAFSGKPIIACAREDSDVGRLVSKYGLGVASFDPDKIRHFIESVRRDGWSGARNLKELSADAQFGRFIEIAESCRLDRPELVQIQKNRKTGST